jgi:hypothetical protein
MPPEDRFIYIIGETGIRHGQTAPTSERQLATSKKDALDKTGEGLLNLTPSHLEFSVNTDGVEQVTLNYMGKSNHPQHYELTDPKIVEILREASEGKEPEARLFTTTEKTHNQRLKKLVGNSHATIKKLRSLKATLLAEKLLKEKGLTKPLAEKEFTEVQRSIGLEVGTMLGHFKNGKKLTDANKENVLDADGNIQYDGPRYVNHGGEAIKSYIHPKTWDGVEREPEPVKKAILSTDDSLRQMQKAIQDLQKAITPDWHMKGPNEERDIDEWAEARQRKGENRAFGFKQPNGRPHKGTLKLAVPTTKTWMDSLNEQGFLAPIIKGVNPEGTRMWIESGGQQFVAFLGMNGSARVEKATFKAVTDPRRKPTVRTAVPTPDMDEMDDSPERGI